MSRISRRRLLAAAPAIGFMASRQGLAKPQALTLEPSGSVRRLPKGLFSASLEAMIEHLIDDPKKIAALAPMNLGYGRFPGGSQSDFYDWRKGQLALEVKPNSSGYIKFWGKVIPGINATWRNGMYYEQYVKFCQSIGAEAIWVPNLETSTVDEQVAWVQHLAAKGVTPRYVEMGNEFYVAMLFDPDSMARWPNEPATRKVIHQYVDALRPHLPKNVKIATQACSENFGVKEPSAGAQRMLHWNDTIKSEDWFDAVTIHLYAQIPNLTDARDTSDPAQAKRVFDAVMAHHDDGLEKVLKALGARVPGKEIWITEWSPRGGDPTPGPNGRDSITHSMYFQSVARAQFTILRIPQVTMSLFFMFNFTPSPVFGLFLPTPDGSFAPMPPALPVIWFAQAANSGVEYQCYLEKGAGRTSGGGRVNESYTPIEGALFKGDTATTLLVQNASASPRTLELPASLRKKAPAKIETLAMPDLTDQKRGAAQIATLPAGRSVELPAFSLTRLIWPG